MNRGLPWTYRICRFLCAVLLRTVFRLRVSGLEHVPRSGGCLLACNHASFLDPPILGVAVHHRLVHFMARTTLFHGPILGPLLSRLEIIPVDRNGGDASALRTALRLLRKGDPVAIFPEGTRSDNGEFLPPRGGVGFLIAKAEVPVIPACIEGAQRAWPKARLFPRPARITIAFGPPIQPAELATLGKGREAFEPLARHVMERIAALRG